MTVAQASIRQLYEQIRVLEAEAARPQRRRRLPHVIVLMVAAAIGAASATGSNHSVSHESAPPQSARHEPVRSHAAPVAHLIDEPAELERAPRRHHPVRRVPAPVAAPAPQPVPAPEPAPVATPVAHVARPVVHVATPIVHVAPHRIAPAPPRPKTAVVPTSVAQTRPVAVGIGAVLVTTSEEPQPATAP